MSQPLKINEIFLSIQGEGRNVGEMMVFVRLAGCNLQCSFCDTKHRKVNFRYTLDSLLTHVSQTYDCRVILWTGGEPMLQLTQKVYEWFHNHGYKQYIETNGTIPVTIPFEHITVSPKTGLDKINWNGFRPINEIRLPVDVNTQVPGMDALPLAENYYLSPIFEGKRAVKKNVDKCLRIIENQPDIWKLSVQIQNLLKIP